MRICLEVLFCCGFVRLSWAFYEYFPTALDGLALAEGDAMKAASSCFLLLFWAAPDVLGGEKAQTDWKVGFAEIKITPEQPLLMSGYAGRTKPFEKVAGDLYVKAMVLEDRDGRRAALVTSD